MPPWPRHPSRRALHSHVSSRQSPAAARAGLLHELGRCRWSGFESFQVNVWASTQAGFLGRELASSHPELRLVRGCEVGCPPELAPVAASFLQAVVRVCGRTQSSGPALLQRQDLAYLGTLDEGVEMGCSLELALDPCDEPERFVA